MTPLIAGYQKIIQNFLDEKISVEKFEDVYQEKFKLEPAPMREEVFHVLDKLFADIEVFSSNEELRGKYPDEYIDEKELRKFAQMAINELEKLAY